MKQSKFLALTLLTASIALSACSKSDDSKPAQTSDVPKTLGFTKPTQGVRLTQSQLEQIQKAFANKPSMILPPGDLVFVPKDMTAETKAKREAQLKAQDSNSYDLLKMVQSTCTKTRPSSHVEATFPIDGDDAKRNLRAGDYMAMNATGGLGSGACPVDLSMTYGVTARVEERDQQADTGKASAAVTVDYKAVMNNPRFANLLGARGMIVQSNMSGLAVAREFSKEVPFTRTLIEFNLAGTYLSLSQDIPFTMASRMITTDAQGTETVVNMRIQMKDFAFNFDSHTSQATPTSAAVTESYINGYPVSAADSVNLFGNNSPTQVGALTAATLK